jgi:hypothetical protein
VNDLLENNILYEKEINSFENDLGLASEGEFIYIEIYCSILKFSSVS